MSKITESAHSENCTIRLPNVCNHNNATTVLAHINGVRFGHGVGIKASDILGAYACSSCHDAVDFRTRTEHSNDYLKTSHLEGVAETILILQRKGLIKT